MSYNRKEIRVQSSAPKRKPNPWKGDIIFDSRGQFEFPGQVVKIDGNNITTHGMPGDILGIPDRGMPRIMNPNQTHHFDGANNVTEIPLFQAAGDVDLNEPVKNKKEQWAEYNYMLLDMVRNKYANYTRHDGENGLTWKLVDPEAKGIDYGGKKKLRDYEEKGWTSVTGEYKDKKQKEGPYDKWRVAGAEFEPDPSTMEATGVSFGEGDDVMLTYRELGKLGKMPLFVGTGPKSQKYLQNTQGGFGSYMDFKQHEDLIGKGVQVYPWYNLPGDDKTQQGYYDYHKSLAAPDPAPVAITEERDGGYIELELDDDQIEAYKAGGYVVEELPKAQNGLVNLSGPRASKAEYLDLEDKVKEFADRYVTSEHHRNLLKKQGYPEDKIHWRTHDVLGYQPHLDTLFKAYGNSMVGGAGEQGLPLGPNQEPGQPVVSYNVFNPHPFPLEEVVSHEWGHIPVSQGFNPLTENERKEFINRLRPGAARNEHDLEPQENRADQFELRYFLDKEGIYDSSKGEKFTQKHLDEYRKKTGAPNRIFRLYEDKDIIWLMNNIAATDFGTDLNKAKFGGSLPKAQDGIYTYSGRPEAKYKKDVSGNWLINLPSLGEEYIPIQDPTGSRRKVLDAQAVQMVGQTTAPSPTFTFPTTTSSGLTDFQKEAMSRGAGMSVASNPELARQWTLEQDKMTDTSPQNVDFIQTAKRLQKEADVRAAEQKRRSQLSVTERFLEDAERNTLPDVPVAVSESTRPLNVPRVDTPIISMADRDIVEDQRNFQQAIETEFRRNAPYFREVYGDDLYDEQGNYDWRKIGEIMSKEGYSQRIEDQKYKEFLQREQAAYDAAPWYNKGLNFVTSTLADPVLTMQNLIFEGKGPMYGQWQGLNDPNENERFYRRATGYDDNWVNWGANFVNPFHHLGEATISSGKGDWGQTLLDLANVGMIGSSFVSKPGLATYQALKPYAETLPQGIRSVMRKEAKIPDLWKRSDLARMTTAEKLADMERRIAAGEKLAPSDYKWMSSVQHSPDALKYASADNPFMMAYKPGTKASVAPNRLDNLAKKLNNPNLSAEERAMIEDALTKSVPTKQQVFENPELYKYYTEQPVEMRAKIDKVLDNPGGESAYWDQDWFLNDLELQEVIGSKRFYSPTEYLSPEIIPGSQFKPVTSAAELDPFYGPVVGGLLSKELPHLFPWAEHSLIESMGDSDNTYSLPTTFPNVITDEGQMIQSGAVRGTPNEEAIYKPSTLRPVFQRKKSIRLQDGGYIEMELDDDQIEKYQAGGFKVERIGEVPEINLRLPQMGYTPRNVNPFMFSDVFPIGDNADALLLGAGINAMFDTPLHNLRAGFDLTATNLTGFSDGKILFNKPRINSPSIKFHYTLPNKKR